MKNQETLNRFQRDSQITAHKHLSDFMFGSITGQNNQENVLFLYAPILNKESVLKNIEKRYHFHCPYTRRLGVFFFRGGGGGRGGGGEGGGGKGGGDF